MDSTNSPAEVKAFESEVRASIERYQDAQEWQELSNRWMIEAFKYRYMYNFTSLGRPVIQVPIDIVALQEIVWKVKPDLIIETGVAHGGSLILSASMLTLLDVCDAIEKGTTMDPRTSKRRVLGIDIDIRKHNRFEIERHPMASRIQLLQGSSIDEAMIDQVQKIAKEHSTVLVLLDSNHTHDHVVKELAAYAHLASVGSYCIVYDTIVEDVPKEVFPDRPWGPGDNPKTAVREFLRNNDDFIVDRPFQDKLILTVAPDGYLRRVK